MKPVQLPLGVRLRDDATFANYYPGANAAALGYVERLCDADSGWAESLIYLWGNDGVGRSHLLQAACLRFEQHVYEEFQQQLPPPGSRILTRKGQGRVLAQEILARKVLAEFEDGRRVIVALDEILTRLG